MNTPYVFKVCSKCGELLPATTEYFYKRKDGKYGLRADCKNCRLKKGKYYYEENREDKIEYQKEYYQKNREHILEQKREYYEENREDKIEYQKQYRKENKEHILEQKREYYQKNKEYILEYAHRHYEENVEYYEQQRKEYYQKNREYVLEQSKKYREENREYILEYQKQYRQSTHGQVVGFNNRIKRRNKLKNQGKGVTPEQWKELMNFFDWKCAYSNEVLNIKTRSIDHIVPLNEGGLNEIWNVVPMYKKYNTRKNARPNVMSWYKEQEYFSEERLAKIVEWQQYAYDKWASEDDEPLILIIDLYDNRKEVM